MRVTFTKTGARRYGVYVDRDQAPALALDPAPGFDKHLPHDLLHFVAEAEAGLDGGVFGDLAAGGNARIFIPLDRRLIPKMWRAQRIRKHRLPDGRRSEQLADELEREWRTHRHAPEPAPMVRKLDALARDWHALPVGGSLTLEWPRPERRAGGHPRPSRARHARRPSRQ